MIRAIRIFCITSLLQLPICLPAYAATPELIHTGSIKSLYWDPDGQLLHWSTDTSCPGGEFPSVCRIRMASPSNADFWYQRFYSADPLQQITTNIAIKGGMYYWFNSGPDVLSHYYTTASPTTAAAAKETPASTGEVAVDDNYVYWSENTASSGKIFRVPLAGGSRELMAANALSPFTRLSADGSGGVFAIGDTGGSLFRFPKVLHRITPDGGGGFVTTLSDIVNTLSYTQDGGTVFFASISSTVTNDVALHSAPVNNIMSDTVIYDISSGGASLDIPNMAVDENNLYWHPLNPTSGHIFRLVRSSIGGAVDVAAITDVPLVTTQDLVSNGENLFWRDTIGIFRLPTASAPQEVDVGVADIEVTQGIQSLDNDVFLVENKWTMARVYPEIVASSSSNAQFQATVKLYAFNDGPDGLPDTADDIPLPGSPLIARWFNVKASGNQRDTLEDSANFVLPILWEQGAYHLRAEISTFAPDDPDLTNNIKLQAVSFAREANICIKFLPIVTTAGLTYWARNPASGSFSPGFLEIKQRLSTLWPMSHIRWYSQGTPLRKPCFLCAPNPPFNLTGNADGVNLLAALWEHNIWDNAPDWCSAGGARTHYIAMVHPGVNTTNMSTGTTTTGFASYGEPNSWVKMLTSGSNAFDTPDGGGTMAQELGHNHNDLFGTGDRWKHVNCNLPAGSDFYDAYPVTDPCNIAELGERSHWGFDRVSDSIIQPDQAGDFMSYRGTKWASPHNWEGIYIAREGDPRPLPLPGLAAATTASDLITPQSVYSVDYLIAIGTVSADAQSAQFMNLFRIPAGVETTPAQTGDPGVAVEDFALEMLSTTDTVLASQTFALRTGTHHAPGGAEVGNDLFYVQLPYATGASFIRVTHQGQEITRTAISPHAPTITIDQPVAGAVFGSAMTIAWTADDADNDTLNYLVQYSTDDGLSWRLLANGVTGTSLSLLDLSNIGGSSAARIRVIASDGINLGTAMSPPFTVLNQPPVASIDAPTDGKVYKVHETVILEGEALDQEDGQIPGTSLQWSLDGPNSPTASGSQAMFTNLAPGAYQAKLTASDLDGATGTATGGFVISPKNVYAGMAPLVNGNCNDNAYGAERQPVLLRDTNGNTATVQYVQTDSRVYVCFSHLHTGGNENYVVLKFDVDNAGKTMDSYDKVYQVFSNSYSVSGSGDGKGGEIYDTEPVGIGAATNASQSFWSAELVIDKSALFSLYEGATPPLVRMYVAQFIDTNTASTQWPMLSTADSPPSWGVTSFSQTAQTITFAPLNDRSYLESPFTLAATSTSSLPVSYKSSTPDTCTVSGNIVTVIKAGVCTIDAAQPGNDSYGSAKPVTQSFTILAPDSDADGLDDFLESGMCTNALDADTDDDGLPDGIEDANADGLLSQGETDPCNADTDNDQVQDGTELGVNYQNANWTFADTNQAVFIPDADPDTVTDPLNPDTDGDGSPEGDEDLNHNGALEAGETDPLDPTSTPAAMIIPFLPPWMLALMIAAFWWLARRLHGNR